MLEHHLHSLPLLSRLYVPSPLFAILLTLVVLTEIKNVQRQRNKQRNSDNAQAAVHLAVRTNRLISRGRSKAVSKTNNSDANRLWKLQQKQPDIVSYKGFKNWYRHDAIDPLYNRADVIEASESCYDAPNTSRDFFCPYDQNYICWNSTSQSVQNISLKWWIFGLNRFCSRSIWGCCQTCEFFTFFLVKFLLHFFNCHRAKTIQSGNPLI